jgi:hypothetical protein
MKKARILSINFATMSHSRFLLKAGEIVHALHTAAFVMDFPNIEPDGGRISTALEKYSAAVGAEDSKSTAALRKSTRADLTDLLVLLALDLEQQAAGDLLKLSRTGYDINKSTKVRTEGNTPTPQNLRLYRRLTGQILAKVKALGGNTVYIVAYSYDPINGPWTTLAPVTNSQNILITGLERGKDVYIKVMAITHLGPSDWSDIATMLVN